MTLNTEHLYCVVKPTGDICLWTFAREEDEAWYLFTKQSVGTPQIRKDAAARGYRCVRVRLALDTP